MFSTDDRRRGLSGRRLVSILVCVALLGAPLGAVVTDPARVGISKPDLFEKSLTAAYQALQQYVVHDDRAGLRRVADIGYRLAQESGFDKFPFSFYVVEMREPNAFALPGGQVFVTRGMLDLGLDDDQLAGLLGHEISHVVFEHGLKIQKRATLLSVLSQALLVGVILGSESSKDDGPRPPPDRYGRSRADDSRGDKIQGTAAAGVVLSELLLRSYSREFEDQADEEGQRLTAAAGFSPTGTRSLMQLLESRLPQSKEYGYWRTHPFFDERVDAAEARAEFLKVQDGHDSTAFRQATQTSLLGFLDRKLEHIELIPTLKGAALTAWPAGAAAEAIRDERLQKRRDAELARPDVSRNYGELIAAYRVELDEVRALTPESDYVLALQEEMTRLDRRATELYPQALEVLASGVFETPFLESFIANYPESHEIIGATLSLARAYARLGKQTEAVDRYLLTLRRQPSEPTRTTILDGLRRLAPRLERLAALEALASEVDDAEVQRLASRRLEELAKTFTKLDNGSEYLARYPQGAHSAVVETRLENLANQLYGEIVLYQGVGDSMKVLDRIQDILTHAPASKAAARLRERAVLDA